MEVPPAAVVEVKGTSVLDHGLEHGVELGAGAGGKRRWSFRCGSLSGNSVDRECGIRSGASRGAGRGETGAEVRVAKVHVREDGLEEGLGAVQSVLNGFNVLRRRVSTTIGRLVVRAVWGQQISRDG